MSEPMIEFLDELRDGKISEGEFLEKFQTAQKKSQELYRERKATLPIIDHSNGTDVVNFLIHYEFDSNIYWSTESGHIQNVLDYLIEELSTATKTKGEDK